MKKEQREQPNRLLDVPNMRDILDSVMRDIWDMDNAASIFRKLLVIDRWLNREWAAVTGHPLPEEVVPANYRLHRQDELASVPVIPAEIVGIGARQCAMTVFARFPNHLELPGENEFIVGFEDDDQRFEIVEFQQVDPTTGAHLDTPPGALAGLYAALITTCRYELDQWRMNVAELEDIELESAILPEPLATPPEVA
jgi:hypothetical protein